MTTVETIARVVILIGFIFLVASFVAWVETGR